MQNFVNYANAALITTSTTFGVAQPNTLPPPSLLVCNAAAQITVTLPNTSSQPPVLPPASPGYGQTIDGVGGGFFMSIINQNGSGTVIVAAASGDQIFTTAAAALATIAASAGAKLTLESFPAQTTWYQIA